jgi:hypothetical protein
MHTSASLSDPRDPETGSMTATTSIACRWARLLHEVSHFSVSQERDFHCGQCPVLVLLILLGLKDTIGIHCKTPHLNP